MGHAKQHIMERGHKDVDTGYLYGFLCVAVVVVVLVPLAYSTEDLRWKLGMAVLQAATLWCSRLFFQGLWEERGSELAELTGIVLYMTCPYRMNMCYGGEGLRAAAAWMLLPLYGLAVARLIRERKPLGWDGLIACVSLAGIGYVDLRFFLITIAVTLGAAIYNKTVQPCVAVAGGCVLFIPGWYRLGKYLLTDAFGELNLSVQSIMPQGYSLGQFFSSYAFREGHPGMGMGLMVCLVFGLWFWFAQGVKWKRTAVYFAWIALVLLFCSTRYCPWDLVQRAGLPFLRLVGMLRTPTVFFGYACACLCVPAVSVVRSIGQRDNKTIAVGLPILIISFGIGVCLYQGYVLHI